MGEPTGVDNLFCTLGTLRAGLASAECVMDGDEAERLPDRRVVSGVEIRTLRERRGGD